MYEFVNRKLGRKGVRLNHARRLAAVQMLSLLPPAPVAYDSTKGTTSFGMMLNGPASDNPPDLADGLGCCTASGIAHSLQIATLQFGEMVTASDDQVLELYERTCGYKRDDPSTDNGGIEDDVINYVTQNGFAGHQLIGHVTIDPRNIDHVTKAISNFDSIYVGAELPLESQHDKIWELVGGSQGVAGSWGGHAF